MTNFHLHPRLQADCLSVGHLPLSQLLLMNDSLYPWFILVPRRTDISEIHQLPPADRQQLLIESCLLAETLHTIYRPDKQNIAAIGNLVSQLHLHHVARYRTDPAWPAPVWGKLPPQPYTQKQAEARIGRLREALADYLLVEA
ncbi:MAG: HIT domain-containing protein [Methylococcales bacterium]|nr:HIT domain-containing protein [Methylococcales bacterium]